MRIQKVIKTYFVFSLLVMSLYAAPYLKNSNDFMANVVGVGAEEKIYSTVNVEISVSPKSSLDYVNPGQNMANVMTLNLKNSGENTELKSLRFKIVDVDPLAIDKVVLIKDDTEIAKALRKNDYLLFDNLNVEILQDGELSLLIAADLNKAVTPGTRFKFEMSSFKDAVFVLNGNEAFASKSFFPVLSEIVTVVKRRS